MFKNIFSYFLDMYLNRLHTDIYIGKCAFTIPFVESSIKESKYEHLIIVCKNLLDKHKFNIEVSL